MPSNMAWPSLWLWAIALLLSLLLGRCSGWANQNIKPVPIRRHTRLEAQTSFQQQDEPEHIVIIGAGWGGLSTAYALQQQQQAGGSNTKKITVVDAAPRVGGLVRDGFLSVNGTYQAEAGQHGFWDSYANIFDLLGPHHLNIRDDVLTDYAEQGQYSPAGQEATWPVYRQQPVRLPTGLAQAAYTKFQNLPLMDRVSAFPLVLAFSEFDNSPEAWKKYDNISFRDLCVKLGVNRRCYEEAFEPMILTGLFAPGAESSAAAALGMAYFFVLSNQNAFDVRWCKGNIGTQILDPWKDKMEQNTANPVNFCLSTRVVGFDVVEDGGGGSSKPGIAAVHCQNVDTQESMILHADKVVFAVGAAALNAFARFSPNLTRVSRQFCHFANLRGTSVLATRIYLDREVAPKYTANACWGFDRGVGMTLFDVKALHGDNFVEDVPGSVLEVDYYHADSLLVLSDDQIIQKVKRDLDTILGSACTAAHVADAAIVRLPQAVNWYFPGSYVDMPSVESDDLANVYFAGDLVHTNHGSWSQEKAFVTGKEAANLIAGNHRLQNVLPLPQDEPHVAVGRSIVSNFQKLVSGATGMKPPSLVDFLF